MKRTYKENPSNVRITMVWPVGWEAPRYTVSWNGEDGREKVNCQSYPEAIRSAESHGAVL